MKHRVKQSEYFISRQVPDENWEIQRRWLISQIAIADTNHEHNTTYKLRTQTNR